MVTAAVVISVVWPFLTTSLPLLLKAAPKCVQRAAERVQKILCCCVPACVQKWIYGSKNVEDPQANESNEAEDPQANEDNEAINLNGCDSTHENPMHRQGEPTGEGETTEGGKTAGKS